MTLPPVPRGWTWPNLFRQWGWKNWPYVIRCALWTRWNRITIPTLSPTYHDTPELMLHGMMALLTRYMTKENRWSVAELEHEIAHGEDEHARAWAESAIAWAREEETIYQWWAVDRPQLEREIEASLTAWWTYKESIGGTTFKPTSDPQISEMVMARDARSEVLAEAHQALEQRLVSEDEDMLVRLVKIRTGMWT